MFAGKSHQWRNLYGLFSRCLRNILTSRNEEFLLGAMADDVLALLLPRKDAFLARALIKNMTTKLNEEIKKTDHSSLTDIMAIEMQWRVADHLDYQESIGDLLDEIYSKLFNRDEDSQNQHYRIVLNPDGEKVKS